MCKLADVADLEARPHLVRHGGMSRKGDEVLRQVDAHYVDPAPGQGYGVAAGTASDIEHPLPRLEVERVDEEPDLLLRPLRERHYPAGTRRPVGPPEMLGDRIEPRTGRYRRRLNHEDGHADRQIWASPTGRASGGAEQLTDPVTGCCGRDALSVPIGIGRTRAVLQ